MNVSIRALKNELSAYVRRVRRGERVVVTDRGRPVAEITAVNPSGLSTDERLRRMAEAGELRLPGPPAERRNASRPSRVKGRPVSATLLEDRD
ncbi:MAG: type II toxin-antitoxin system prevent-host-death family antitoxin [Polyangiaceae bacterium]